MDLVRFFFDYKLVWAYRAELASGLLVTLKLALTALALSLVPSLLLASGRRYGPRWMRGPLMALVWMVRSVPAVVSVVLIFFALPFAGLRLSAFFSVALAVTTVQAIYYSEVFRGALAAVDRGQWEAGYSLGLRPLRVLRYIVLPQAVAVAAPTFVSSSIQLVQNTTIASAVALDDLLSAALNVQTVTGSPSPVFAAALLYLLFLLPVVRLARRLEGRLTRSLERVAPGGAGGLAYTEQLMSSTIVTVSQVER